MIKYTHTNNSEKLYFDSNSTINPSAASGKIVIKVMISTIFSALSAPTRCLRIIKISCPPSSDNTGRKLNNPTERFDIANGKTNLLPNKYNR